ncbi:MAG TPA: TIGR02186 family protein, partial [Stellaceae bacterium]|nr:TIGR02186 family protein [Stellaceae bacterium]
MLLLLLASLGLAAASGPARAQALVADLTNHLVAITTGFTGTSVVLFGATDGNGDVIVVVRGPERDIT